MKNLVNILNEGLTNKQSEIVGDLIIQMFEHSQLSKDDIVKLFKNVKLDIIQKIEQYLMDRDSSQAMAYMANDDDFIKQENHDKIVDTLADYFLKYIVQ